MKSEPTESRRARTERCVSIAGVALLVASIMQLAAPATAAVLPTNGRIAFGLFNPAAGDDALYTANPDGSHIVQIYPGPSEAPRWSPDGTQIAVVCFEDNFAFVRNCTMNHDGSNFLQLIPDVSHYTLNEGVSAWSPDGSRIAFEGWDDAHPEVTPGVFSMRSSDGSDIARITTSPYGGHDVPGGYSPDGSRLVFTRDDPLMKGDPVAVFVANVDGTGVKQLTQWAFGGTDASWSPDGAKIVLRGPGGIFLINPDGTELMKIHQDTERGASFEMSWSPDGTKIIFARFAIDRRLRHAQQDLYTINRDGSGLTQIPNTTHAGRPSWGTYPVAS